MIGTVPGTATGASQPAVAPPPPAWDARYLALRNFAISITILNILGYTVLGFEQPWSWPLFAVLVGYSAELILESLRAWAERRRPAFLGGGGRRVYEFLLPAHITSLAVNMLLYANDQFWPVAFGVVVGIGTKQILRARIAGRTRHFMNPSNFGITAVLLVFSSWVSIAPPYQFTENPNTLFRIVLPLIIAIAGTVINGLLTKKLPLILGWLGGFALQALIRHAIWDVSLYSALGPLTGVALILYTNYMVTDPGTTPFKARSQFMFGSSVAAVYGVLMFFNVVYTLFFATTVVCALRGIGWWVASALEDRRRRQAHRLSLVRDTLEGRGNDAGTAMAILEPDLPEQAAG